MDSQQCTTPDVAHFFYFSSWNCSSQNRLRHNQYQLKLQTTAKKSLVCGVRDPICADGYMYWNIKWVLISFKTPDAHKTILKFKLMKHFCYKVMIAFYVFLGECEKWGLMNILFHFIFSTKHTNLFTFQPQPLLRQICKYSLWCCKLFK